MDITVVAFELAEGDYVASEVIADLMAAMAKVPTHLREKVYFCVERMGDYEDAAPQLQLRYSRPETPQETASRLAKEEEWQRRRREGRVEQLKRDAESAGYDLVKKP